MNKTTVCPHGCGKEWVGTTNRRATSPLDPDATAAANKVSATNCQRLTAPDGSTRPLTMSDDDYFCRRVWMDAYLEALSKKEGKKNPPKPKTKPEAPVAPCPKASLIVKIKDFDGKVIEGATVNVERLGDLLTDKEGLADYGEVPPDFYNITARKESHRPGPDKPVGPAETSVDVPACATKVVPLELDPIEVILRENLIFIGSEQEYDLFWLKMMFIAAAYVEAGKGEKFRSADRRTIAYVDHGYTKAEKLTLDFLRDKRGFNMIKIGSVSEVVNYMNDRPEKTDRGRKEKTLLQDVAFFCHGQPGKIRLNYNDSPDIDFTESELASTKHTLFVPDGRIYSYACRTGVSKWAESFDNDADAGPEESLAQKLADHFKVEVHAFLRRSFYGDVLREKTDSARIAAVLKKARETQEGQIIAIPPEHEGLPHPGLAEGGLLSKTDEEGTNEYALWRNAGGRMLPRAAETPEGLSAAMWRFTPK